jgi:prepilin-type N-terminal cleavage/methylation domain-containing protein
MNNIIKKISYKNKAFTLVEVLVSMVVSGLLLTLILGSFWLLIEVNQKNEVSGELQKQTSFALLRIADNVKNYSVDYDAYKDFSTSICKNRDLKIGTQQLLCLGGDHVFEKKKDNLFMDGQPLFSEYFEVVDIQFLVSPTANPFDDITEKSRQIQPKVTILLEVKSKKYENISLQIQSTISSRKYTK